MYEIAILSNGDHVMYELKDSDPNTWHFPCIVNIGKNPDGPFIYFDPMTVFCKDDRMEPIRYDHILATYEPSENLIEVRKEFEQRYHKALNEVDTENDQSKAKIVKLTGMNNMVH